MPEVSVIIPTYNRAEYVTQAIDSVLAQIYTDYEIIVIDDGSIDNTREALETYMNKIHYIYQENAGVSAARNRGILEAQGQWIAFLDSDDEWLPEKLSRQMGSLARTGAKVCFTNVTLFQESAPLPLGGQNKCCIVRDKIFTEPFDLILNDSLGLYIQTMVIDRNLLNQVGCFDERLVVAEDTRLIYNLAFKTAFIFIFTPLVLINRTTERKGLINDNLETRHTLCDAHISILSDAYFRCRKKNKSVTANLCRLLGYSLSRRAEIACVDKDYRDAKRFARDALHFGGDFKTYLRSIAVRLCPLLVAKRCKRVWNWRGNSSQ